MVGPGCLKSGRRAAVLQQAKRKRQEVPKQVIQVEAPQEVPDILPEEVAGIVKKANNRSAPGPDGIDSKAVKLINKKHPALLASV